MTSHPAGNDPRSGVSTIIIIVNPSRQDRYSNLARDRLQREETSERGD